MGSTAIVVTGMMRNYEAAALSIPALGSHDTYAITWDSAESHLDEYAKLVPLKGTSLVSERDFESIYCHPYSSNPMRMLWLWQSIFKFVPNTYEKYIIVRPDVFYWTDDVPGFQCSMAEQVGIKTPTIPHLDSNGHQGVADQLITVDRKYIDVLGTIFDDVVRITPALAARGIPWDIHYLLHHLFASAGIDVFSQSLSASTDRVIVRDTFLLLPGDVYSKELYQAIFYDTAAWWRRTHRTRYDATLRQ